MSIDINDILQGYKKAMKRVRYLEEELAQLEADRIKSNCNWSSVPTYTGSVNKSIEDYLIKCERLEQEIKEIKDEYEPLEAAINESLPEHRKLLNMVYRDGMSISKVKQQLGLFDNVEWIKIHKTAKMYLVTAYGFVSRWV